LTLMETKNFSRTAEELYLAQSTVSKRIMELEKELGQMLFIREGGVRLTNAGKAFREYAEQMLNLKHKALEEMARTAQYQGYLVIGSAYAFYNMYLSKVINPWLERNPEVSLRIKIAHSGEILNKLQKGRIDLAFTHHPLHHPEYESKWMGEDAVVLVAAGTNKELPQEIAFSEIRTLPMIDTNFLYTPTRQQLFGSLYRSQIEVDVAYCALPLLQDSKRCALLPEKLIEEELCTGKLRKISVTEGEIPVVQHYAVYKKRNP
ncbi:MAG: LysR family transcriptional regulator, partial [bacterium]|nr:LysR family transcriptional regulator [bacterium]